MNGKKARAIRRGLAKAGHAFNKSLYKRVKKNLRHVKIGDIK